MTNSAKQSNFTVLRAIDCSDKIEKKNGLSYLSWAWAVDRLLLADPDASWEYPEAKTYGDTMMVYCTVTAFGKPRTAQLPVMNHKNQCIPHPDAFAVNTAMQRCLVKAIALHGLGLYIYAGEDVPDGQKSPAEELADKFLTAFKAEYPGKTEEEMLANAAAALLKIRDEANKDQELYQLAWKLLDAPTRAGIKKLMETTKQKEAA